MIIKIFKIKKLIIVLSRVIKKLKHIMIIFTELSKLNQKNNKGEFRIRKNSG